MRVGEGRVERLAPGMHVLLMAYGVSLTIENDVALLRVFLTPTQAQALGRVLRRYRARGNEAYRASGEARLR